MCCGRTTDKQDGVMRRRYLAKQDGSGASGEVNKVRPNLTTLLGGSWRYGLESWTKFRQRVQARAVEAFAVELAERITQPISA